jgi:hypothetical protein
MGTNATGANQMQHLPRPLGQANERNMYRALYQYASLASMLNPPMSEEDLAGGMVGNFLPEVQNGMICGNLKTTEDALAYLSNMQALEITQEHMRPPRWVNDERDTNTRLPRGRTNDTANPESKNNPQTGNVRCIQGPCNNSGMRRHSPRQFGRNGESSSWGSSRQQERHPFNLSTQEFKPRTDDGVRNKSIW